MPTVRGMSLGFRRLCDTAVVAVVWYASWEMECCGKPFAVGDVVEWNLMPVPDGEWLQPFIGSDLAAQVTHQEDHHDQEDGVSVRRARVLSIRCAFCRYAPAHGGEERALYPVAGTAEIVSAQRVDGREGGVLGADLYFNGYLIEVDLGPEDRVARRPLQQKP